MNWDLVQTLLRSALKVGCGFLIAAGRLTSSDAESIIGALIGLVGIIWGILHRTPKAVVVAGAPGVIAIEGGPSANPVGSVPAVVVAEIKPPAEAVSAQKPPNPSS